MMHLCHLFDDDDEKEEDDDDIDDDIDHDDDDSDDDSDNNNYRAGTSRWNFLCPSVARKTERKQELRNLMCC
jgi:hypothetical protein